MQHRVQIMFRGLEPSVALEEHVRARAAELEAVTHRVTRCHVNLEVPQRFHHIRKQYRVRISLLVPGAELVVCGNPRQGPPLDMHASIDAAFDDMERMLHDYLQRRGEDEQAASY